MAFIFGGNTPWTYDELKRQRELANMLATDTAAPRNVGEGLNAIGNALAYRGITKRAGKEEARMRDQYSVKRGEAFGGGAAGMASGPSYAPPAPADPSSPTGLGDDAMAALGKKPIRDYRESLIGTESGGKWSAQNAETGAGGKKGHFGRVQFGQARLQEAMNAGVIPQGTTPEQFMASPDLQMAAEDWHFMDLESQLADLVGREVNGQPMDIGALVAMGHLGGAGGARKFVESGGAYNPADSFGTSLADYARKHGGTVSPFSGGAPQGNSGGMDLASLIALTNEPGFQLASPQEQEIVKALIAQQTTAADPMKALELEKAQLEIEAMRDPKPEPGYRTLTADEITKLGLPPGAYQMGPKGEIKAIGGGGVNVNVDTGGGSPDLGKLSTDYGYLTNPDGTIKRDPVTGLAMAAPVPGSPAAIEAAATQEKEQLRDTQAANSASIVLQDIDKAIDQTTGWTAGLGGAIAGLAPGTPARDLQGSINTIVANIGFDRLQQMREASPTGGALGGIAVPELVMLQAVLGSLTRDQSPEQLKANLQRLKEVYEPIARKAAAYPNAADFGFTGGDAPTPIGDFATMGIAEIGQVDIGSLTPEQMDALEARMTELGL